MCESKAPASPQGILRKSKLFKPNRRLTSGSLMRHSLRSFNGVDCANTTILILTPVQASRFVPAIADALAGSALCCGYPAR